MYKKLLALSTFAGTTIGVGLFGLPYVTAQVGFVPMVVYFIVLGVVMTLVNLAYGEIVLRTKGNHRLPGYNRIYLRHPWLETVSYISTTVGLTGSLLAYIIVGGSFLASLAMPYLGGGVFLYSTIFFAVGLLIIYFGAGPVSKTEFFSLGIFFAALVVISGKAWPYLNVDYLASNNLHLNNFFLPYGVILFSLGGATVIPELKEILHRQTKSLKNVIILGSIIPVITYLLFIVTVYGVTGAQTTEDALAGLNRFLGSPIIQLGFVFGILTTFTSFLTLGITLKNELHYDRKISPGVATIIACLPAYLLYLIGFNNFIIIIGFIGAVTMGFDTVITMVVYLKAKATGQRVPEYTVNLSKATVIILTVMFLAGVVIEIFQVTG